MKHRIWDLKNRKYVNSVVFGGSYLIEKYTGFKDADGVRIYENDVWKRIAPMYRNGLFWKGHDIGCVLVFKTSDGTWSFEDEPDDCKPHDGFVIGTVHDVEWI